MGMKNIIGLVNPADRQRTGNLDVHVTSGNKLYRQIAQLNEHITPSLTLLDCWKAIIRGGPTPGSASSAGGGLPSEDGNLTAVASTDRIAADVTGLAILKTVAVAGERVHSYGVWDNPQIAEAVASGVGITGLDQYEVSGPTVPNLQDYLDMITG